ncbi:MAG: hypothetical protein Q8Q09_20850 [Deltaproteobacteria bacterium]|nr:hypothetical protein [Deltaproteobacteria bacterium]
MTQNDERDSVLPPPVPDDENREPQGKRPKKLIDRIFKRSIESGFEAISKSEDTFRFVVDKFKDRELAQLALDQIDETKNGLYRAVAKEMRDFLENTSLASELKNALTGLAFEVKMEIRFKATDDDGRTTIRPTADVDVTMKDRDDRAKDRSKR